MPQFTSGELKVISLLWKHGEMKPSEIQDRFPEEIKNPALRSYLSILLKKGHVKRRKVGKAYHYKAVTKERSAYRSTLRDLVDAYCDGSTQALMMNLIRAEKISDEELLKLRKLAAEEDRPSSETKRKKT